MKLPTLASQGTFFPLTTPKFTWDTIHFIIADDNQDHGDFLNKFLHEFEIFHIFGVECRRSLSPMFSHKINSRKFQSIWQKWLSRDSPQFFMIFLSTKLKYFKSIQWFSVENAFKYTFSNKVIFQNVIFTKFPIPYHLNELTTFCFRICFELETQLI